MGPLFSLMLIAMASAALSAAVFLVLRMFLRTADALQRAGGFVIGTSIGATLSGGVIALAMGLMPRLRQQHRSLLIFLQSLLVRLLAGPLPRTSSRASFIKAASALG